MIPRAFSIHPSDSVAVLLDDAVAGPGKLLGLPCDIVLSANQPISLGHKIALRAHKEGDAVTKYGVRIGPRLLPLLRGIGFICTTVAAIWTSAPIRWR